MSSDRAFPEVAKETHAESRPKLAPRLEPRLGPRLGPKLGQQTASSLPSCRAQMSYGDQRMRVRWRAQSRELALVTVLHTSASRSFSTIRASLHERREEIYRGGNFDVDVFEDRGGSGAVGRSCDDRSEATDVSLQGRQLSVATVRSGDVHAQLSIEGHGTDPIAPQCAHNPSSLTWAAMCRTSCHREAGIALVELSPSAAAALRLSTASARSGMASLRPPNCRF